MNVMKSIEEYYIEHDEKISKLEKVIDNMNKRITQMEIITGLDEDSSERLMSIINEHDLFNKTLH